MTGGVRSSPRARAALLERERPLPPGPGERLVGYGVLGLAFDSGDVLAFRRVAASSVGPPFTSLWHRDPEGRWTFYVDVEPSRCCPRWYGPAVERVVVSRIDLRWTGPFSVALAVPGHRCHWSVRLRSTLVTRGLGAVQIFLPSSLRRSAGVMDAVGRVAGPLLGAGTLGLVGRTPNGHAYVTDPVAVWRIDGSAAVVEGRELGSPEPAGRHADLGGYPVPEGGLFVIARTYVDAVPGVGALEEVGA